LSGSPVIERPNIESPRVSALEKLSALPLPPRAVIRALPTREPAPVIVDGGFTVLAKLAARLLPCAVVVLYRAGHEPDLLTWPRGVMGRRRSVESLARALCSQATSGMERHIASLAADRVLGSLPEVREAGPLGFASLPLPGLESGAVLAVIRKEGAWEEEDRSLLRELAVSFAGECERERLRKRTAELEAEAALAEELRAREAQTRVSQRICAVAPLLSGVCHELNNPLTSIKSFAELLLLDARSEDDREALEIVQREAHRAARIVSDLRTVARQSQEEALRREFVDVNEVVRSVARARAREMEAGGIEIRCELTADLPATRAVRDHLEQVATQLVSNAMNAMEGREEARVLTLATSRTERGVCLLVRDTGRGIAPEHLTRIFDPFWTSGRSSEGTGLGLSLVHSIISSHGGRITAESQLGRGSTIRVELPLAEEVQPEVSTGDERPASRGLRVLVVDDEAPIRFSLSRYMERRGHEVHQAADGGAALRMIDEAADRQYDIIVADLCMPGLDGECLLGRLRERGDGLEQRLIFMTGDAQSPCANRLLQDSGIPVMWKPFELAEVAQVIEAQARLLAG
jgi:signal transduction histidine kinase/ActR/RegA family two-component response regulator